MGKVNCSVVILTYNEEENIAQALASVSGWAEQVLIVDSGSTDRTVDIAHQYGALVVTHPFTNQAEQFNWSLDNLSIETEWVLRLDADEYLSPELREEIVTVLPQLPAQVCGLYMKRRMIFLRRWIRHGSYYPIWLLRLFRYRKARSEQKEMDEQIVLLTGSSGRLQHDFIHEDHKGLSDWTRKHEAYAARQARTLQRARHAHSSEGLQARLFGHSVERKRWFKEKVYSRAPLFTRAFLYFIYRYFLRLGFLDGREGLIFHFLHAGWYLFYVDAKTYEVDLNERNLKSNSSERQKALVRA